MAWKYNRPIAGGRCSKEESDFFEKCSDEYISMDQEYSKDLLAFISHCNKNGVPPKSVKNWVSIVKEFLAHNEKLVNVSRIKKKLPKGNGFTNESIPDVNLIKNIVNHADFTIKFLILFLCSSGLRINECLLLRIQDVKEKDGIGIVNVKFTKNGEPRTVFITPEVLEMYKIWVERERDVYLKSSNGRRKLFLKNQKSDLLFPFVESTADTKLETALSHSGNLEYKENKTIDGRQKKTIHFHLLRKYFITTCAINGMPDAVRLSIEGHQKTGMDQIYGTNSR